jgi:hypothetical protein
LSRRRALALGGAALGTLAVGTSTLAGAQQDGGARSYRVTVANLTAGQPFTPVLAAAHTAEVELFAVGDPATEQIQALAENGNLDPLVELAGATEAVRGAGVGTAPLVPQADPADTGNPFFESVTVEAEAGTDELFLSVVCMLIATNDGIVGVDTVPLPEAVNESRTYYANGYDVGTELNTELFADLVPEAKTLVLGGEPEGTAETDPELAEDGVIRPHPGIEGVGNLPPSVYDWPEPSALVQVERLNGSGDDESDPGTETPSGS